MTTCMVCQAAATHSWFVSCYGDAMQGVHVGLQGMLVHVCWEKGSKPLLYLLGRS